MIETGIKFDFCILFTILFVIFIYAGRHISANSAKINNSKSYWHYSFLAIIFYSLIVGLRYARGRDYLWYKFQYENVLNPPVEQEPLFMLFNKIFYFLDFPYWLVFIIYSLIWIYLFFLFFKHFQYLGTWGVPMLFLSSVGFTETAIRQAVAMAFVLPVITSLFEKKWKNACVWSLISILIHTASAITIFLILFVFFFIKRKINVWIAILAYLFFAYIWDVSNIDIIANYISLIDLGSNKMNSYIENSDKWFSSDGINIEEYQQGGFAKFALALFSISVFYLGSKSIDRLSSGKKDNSIFFYNIFIIASIATQAFFMLEILRRMFVSLYIFWAMVVASIFYVYPIKKKKSIRITVIEFIILFYIFSYFIIKNRYLLPSQMFVWDIGEYTHIIS